MKEQKNIEELFKQGFERFEIDPGEQTWASIKSQLNAPIAEASTATSQASQGIWATSGVKVLTAVVAVSLVGLSFVAYNFFNDAAKKINKEEVQAPIENSQEKTIKEKVQEETIQSDQRENEAPAELEKIELEETSKPVIESPVVNNSKAQIISEDKTNSVENIEPEPKQAVLNEESSTVDAEIDAILASSTGSATDNNSSSKETAADMSSGESVNNNIEQDAQAASINSEEELRKLELRIPNVFTPNNDGVNNVFNIDGKDLDNLDVKIFSKSGKIVHEWTGLFGYWDGRYRDGTAAPNDIYFYQAVIVKDGKEHLKKGTITLMR